MDVNLQEYMTGLSGGDSFDVLTTELLESVVSDIMALGYH